VHAESCVACQAALGEAARAAAGDDARAPLVGTLRAGRRLGDLRLREVLGAGATAVVWSAERPGGELVAIKFLRIADARLLRRMRREARLFQSVGHPNLVRIEAFVETEVGPALVMEHLRGESFARRLAEAGRLGVEEATSVLAPAFRAVAALHAAGIVHRDLKPSNLFLERTDGGAVRPRVLDLGLGKRFLREGDTSRPTSEPALIGTPRYMAPEQLVAAADIDARADLWSLGAVLYESLAGRPHVSAHRAAHVLREITAGIPPLASVAPDVPPHLAELASRLLSVDRSARPSAAAGAEILERA
jgi:serine/threonine-protein kinase